METSRFETETSGSAMDSDGKASPRHLPAASFVFTGGTPVSFRDMVMGEGNRREPSPRLDLVSKQLAEVSLVEGDRLRPSVRFSEEAMRKLSEPWEDALVISVLGLKVGFLVLKDRLCRMWGIKGRFEMIDLGYGFFLVKFDRAEDRSIVVEGGPWMVFNHYLAVSLWTRDFSPATCKIMKTLVWVRLPALGLVYYEEEALKIIASTIGKPIKVDANTLTVNRGKYARICVEIDLGVPVVSSILINGKWQRVEYEGLHWICTWCGRYGHSHQDCSEPLQGIQTEDNNSLEGTGNLQLDSCEQGSKQKAVEEMAMCSDDAKDFPPQPPIGEWVVVQQRRKKEKCHLG